MENHSYLPTAFNYTLSDFLVAFKSEDILISSNEKNKTRVVMEKGFGERVAYIMFGIPRNCIEGLFVGRKTEKNKKQLLQLKSLFPDCYICNIDGKVIVE